MRLYSVLFAATSAALLLTSGTSHAGSSLTDISLNYRLYVGGGKAAKVFLNARLGEGKYSVEGQGKTTGTLGRLAKVHFSGVSTGRLDGVTIQPGNHEHRLQTKGRRGRHVVMAFDKNGKPKVSANPGFHYGRKRVPISPAHTLGTIDPVSSFIVPVKSGASALHPSQCQRAAAIFDGQQRYDITLRHKASYGAYKLKSAKYKGPAIRCVVSFRPVAGYKKSGFVPALARRSSNIDVVLVPAGEGQYLVPLRVRFPTPLGQGVFQATNFNSKTVTRAAALRGD